MCILFLFWEIFSKGSKLHRGEAALHRRYLGHGSSSSIMLLIGRQSVLGLFIRYDLVTTCQSAPMISHSYPLNQKPAAGSSRVDSCCELNHSDLCSYHSVSGFVCRLLFCSYQREYSRKSVHAFSTLRVLNRGICFPTYLQHLRVGRESVQLDILV